MSINRKNSNIMIHDCTGRGLLNRVTTDKCDPYSIIMKLYIYLNMALLTPEATPIISLRQQRFSMVSDTKEKSMLVLWLCSMLEMQGKD